MRIDRSALWELVTRVLIHEGRNRASISIAVVDDEVIHRINLKHLGHDWPTDVITFPLSDPDEEVLVGELVISAQTACTAARERAEDPVREFALYVVHGLLHLCGYDDRTEDAAASMRTHERQALEALGFPNSPPP
jgi:probable rRNA maturation factor